MPPAASPRHKQARRGKEPTASAVRRRSTPQAAATSANMSAMRAPSAWLAAATEALNKRGGAARCVERVGEGQAWSPLGRARRAHEREREPMPHHLGGGVGQHSGAAPTANRASTRASRLREPLTVVSASCCPQLASARMSYVDMVRCFLAASVASSVLSALRRRPSREAGSALTCPVSQITRSSAQVVPTASYSPPACLDPAMQNPASQRSQQSTSSVTSIDRNTTRTECDVMCVVKGRGEMRGTRSRRPARYLGWPAGARASRGGSKGAVPPLPVWAGRPMGNAASTAQRREPGAKTIVGSDTGSSARNSQPRDQRQLKQDSTGRGHGWVYSRAAAS